MKLVLLIPAIAVAIAAANAHSQSYPVKPVRLIVSGAAGGSLDIPARAVAERLRDRLSLIVENQPAAGGTIAVGGVAKAAPDGYTLVYGFNGPLAYAPFLFSKLPYDPLRDLTPVIWMGGQPFTLGVAPSLGVNNVKELIDLLRINPGKYNYSSLGNGSGSHLTMELVKATTKTFMLHIPYNGAPPAAVAVATGDAHATFLPASVMLPHVQAGRIKLLAVSTLERFSLTPEIPTVAESGGLKNFDSDGWNGILAPAGTPREVVLRINRDINDALASNDVRAILTKAQIRPRGGSPEQFGELMRGESQKWGPVIKYTGARLD
ncbi:MAG: tripartite tricarboxylate transporter substrate binding protein [Betaproteobacteria bacterium]|nr:tripartite tricarboxylate transporter substrate binding protein [Betaproteobacteria bacterium]